MKFARFCFAMIFVVCLSSTAHPSTDTEISELDQRTIIKDVLGIFEKRYVFADVADEAAARIRHKLESGDYGALTDVASLSDQLTNDLREITKDGHIIVYPIQSGAFFKADDENLNEAEVRDHARDNFGFREVRRLTGNVGYVRLDHFDYAEFGGATATAAITFLANCDALIFDLRENSGGREEMVQFLFSYLWGPSIPLLTFYDRDDKVVHKTYSLAYVPGPRLPDIPVYVLTSGRTASAGEAFTYNLQSYKRATIVGGVTRGIAHWIDVVDLPDHELRVNVPYARPVSAVTGGNWEGTGVVPDIEVPAVKALGVAHVHALEELADDCGNTERCRNLEWDLVAARAQASPLEWHEQIMAAYTGIYAEGRYKIHIKDGQLYWRYRPDIDYVLLPLTEDLFAFDDTDDLRFRIIRAPDGAVSGYQLVYQNGETGSIKPKTGELP